MKRIISIPLFIFCILSAPAVGAADETMDPLFSHGSGLDEVLIFTDYFCPPCRKIEPYLETALDTLHRSGFKITFIDKPIHSITPLYSKYFLYASKASNSFADTLRIRSELFAIAETRNIHSERELLQALKDKSIAIALMDVAPVFDRWSQLIRQFEVRGTPTCIVRRSGRQVIRYVGSRDIKTGIDRLIKELTPGK